jgi:NitT/TauT family transport system ATP-binding protein
MIFGSGENAVYALKDANLEVKSGEFVSLVGPSGCGKTTALNLVAGFLSASKGVVRIGDHVAGPPDGRRVVVFQDDAVFPWLTVRKNLEYGPRVQGKAASSYRQTVEKYLALVGLEQFGDAYPKNLSGGMRKRVDLARAYVSDPEVMLMDEPFGALDIFTKESMWEILTTFRRESRKTVIFVTHDIEEAIMVSDRVIVMSPRPARITAEVEIPFAFPRHLDARNQPEFQALRQEIVRILGAYHHE